MLEMTEKHSVEALFNDFYGFYPVSVNSLPGAGSGRSYFRMTAGEGNNLFSVIGVYGDNIAENRSFVCLSGVFSRAGLAVPEVYVLSDDGRCCLQQDLGDCQLFDLLRADDSGFYIEESMRMLAAFQTVDREKWKDLTFSGDFCRRQAMWDLNYFKYEYLKNTAVVFDEDLLEDDFCSLASCLSEPDPEAWGFMYRDFQSRNIMIYDNRPWMIDFQGGRFGPALYDAVSFLWQAKAGFDDAFRTRMLDIYASEFCRIRGLDKSRFLRPLGQMILFRTLQVLGAYGFRGLVERRSHFIESIPGALRNLETLFDQGVLDPYPELGKICCGLLADKRFRHIDNGDGLLVEIWSFSYKKGYPADYSGNGGGFMFDCRGMHNPGRYDRYKPLTGLDEEVREFLEEKGEAGIFVLRAMDMVSPSVETYMSRGFSRLQIGFGCTGGRHRSVYCAEVLGSKLRKRFPRVKIRIIHREQKITKEL